MEYNKISQEIISKLQALVGAQNVLTEGEQLEIYAHDEVTDPAYHHMPEAVVFAENATDSHTSQPPNFKYNLVP